MTKRTTAYGSDRLLQTGNEQDSKLQVLGSLSIVFMIGSFVYFTRKEQAAGLN